MLTEKIGRLETTLDHLTGEELGAALGALNEMPEVLDAVLLHGLGKKNRPVGVLQVLCSPANIELVAAAIFRHTHSLGIRFEVVERFILPRSTAMTELDGREMPVKNYQLENNDYSRIEADALQTRAREMKTGMPAFRFRKGT